MFDYFIYLEIFSQYPQINSSTNDNLILTAG